MCSTRPRLRPARRAPRPLSAGIRSRRFVGLDGPSFEGDAQGPSFPVRARAPPSASPRPRGHGSKHHAPPVLSSPISRTVLWGKTEPDGWGRRVRTGPPPDPLPQPLREARVLRIGGSPVIRRGNALGMGAPVDGGAPRCDGGAGQLVGDGGHGERVGARGFPSPPPSRPRLHRPTPPGSRFRQERTGARRTGAWSCGIFPTPYS